MAAPLLSKMFQFWKVKREAEPRINPKGNGFKKLKEEMAVYGIELYANTDLKVYHVWRDGNHIPNETADPFDTIKDVKVWWARYKKQIQ